jgi:hypothetical protein
MIRKGAYKVKRSETWSGAHERTDEIAALKAEIAKLRAALRLFVVHATYPVSTEINPKGYAWRPDSALDYALEEGRKALGLCEQSTADDK